jgi:hypothetical protein
MKQCNKCLEVKPLSEYHKKITAKDGLMWWCNTCHKQYVKEKYHLYKTQPGYIEREKRRLTAYRQAHPEKIIEGAKKFDVTHPGYKNAQSKKHYLGKKNRTPSWLTKDDFWLIEQAYELAVLRSKMFGFAWHVDHVVPLRGRLVSGLHVPHNLQVIPAKVNRSKSNRF